MYEDEGQDDGVDAFLQETEQSPSRGHEHSPKKKKKKKKRKKGDAFLSTRERSF